MSKDNLVDFKQWKCKLVFGCYSNGRTAIRLIDSIDGSPVATATVNLPDTKMDKDEIAIKNYSGNEGIFEALIEAGVISEPVRFVGYGYIENIPVCKFLLMNL